MDEMKIDGAGSLGTETTVHKDEEMPYEGKTISQKSTDVHGMKLEGDSDASEPENQDVDDTTNKE